MISECKELERCSFCDVSIKEESHWNQIQKKYELRMNMLEDKIKEQRRIYSEGKQQLEEYHRSIEK
jgi:hypothetical protein